jgi:hypothetical protein
MIYLSIGLTIVGLTQIFPYSVDVAGISTTELITSISEDEATIQSLISSGNIVEYAIAAGYMGWQALKMIVAVLFFVLGGFAAILELLGVSSEIALLLQAGVDFLILFEFSQTLFNRG